MIKIYLNKKENTRGQVLVETIVALGMVVIGLLGLLSLLSNSIGLTRVISDQYTGSYLAGEGIELVKNLADNNVYLGQAFNNGLSGCSNSCRISREDLSVTPGREEISVGDPARSFNRQITFEEVSPDKYLVRSIVEWSSRGGSSYSIEVDDFLYDWRSNR